MLRPKPRGTLSEVVLGCLGDEHPSADTMTGLAPESADDAQIALWALYHLHYAGFDDVPAAHEWHPGFASVRARLESDLERDLRADFAAAGRFWATSDDAEIGDELFALVEAHDGASLASYVQRDASHEQVLQLLRLRSLYHLQEADPTSWVVPRLGVRAKAALVELQYDEYGCGNPARLHSGLFARGLAACDLDPRPGAYVDQAPVEVLRLNNAMTLFGLHRRLRGAALGHLAAFEATSSLPSRRMSQGLDRLGFPEELIAYYDEHVQADAVHEQLAARNICGSLVTEEPELRDDVLFGAFTCLDLESRMTEWLLTHWEAA